MSLLKPCVTVLQIPVTAKLQVTCPFVVPFNQASQVINCWTIQDVSFKSLYHIDTADHHLGFAPINL